MGPPNVFPGQFRNGILLPEFDRLFNVRTLSRTCSNCTLPIFSKDVLVWLLENYTVREIGGKYGAKLHQCKAASVQSFASTKMLPT